MNGEILHQDLVVALNGSGTNGGVTLVTFDASVPYKNLTIWVVGAATLLSIQPLTFGAADGSATVFNSATPIAKKVFQQANFELRPRTQGLKYQDSNGNLFTPTAMQTSLQITSTNAAAQNVTVYFLAEAAE